MSIKDEKGLTGVDIAISLIIITIFIAMIANLIATTNLTSKKINCNIICNTRNRKDKSERICK